MSHPWYSNYVGLEESLGGALQHQPRLEYTTAEVAEPETLPAAEQRLRLSLSKKQRGGKEVTLITGFIGSSADLRPGQDTTSTLWRRWIGQGW